MGYISSDDGVPYRKPARLRDRWRPKAKRTPQPFIEATSHLCTHGRDGIMQLSISRDLLDRVHRLAAREAADDAVNRGMLLRHEANGTALGLANEARASIGLPPIEPPL